MTQDEVADKLGVARPTIVQIEQGKRPVSGLELQTLAYLFAIDIRNLFADEFAEDDVVHALFRSHEDVGEDSVKQAGLLQVVQLNDPPENSSSVLDSTRSVTKHSKEQLVAL